MNARPAALVVALMFAFYAVSAAFGQTRIGADAGYPRVAALLETFPFAEAKQRVLTPEETTALLTLAGEIALNVFELLDDAYRWAAPRGIRLVLDGASLRASAANFNMGGARIDALLPIEKTDRIEIGAVRTPGQEAMDVYLAREHAEYIELGTAVMAPRFGFRSLSPNLFDQAFGIEVKRFPFSTTLEKLELYSPGKGAIYVKALDRPKRWNLNVIKPLSR